jgi:bisphosphoglycerate-independent phosphoglycerate mutase (AlkP superfamily)
MAAGSIPLRTLDDARSGAGLTNDIDGKRARGRGFEVPVRTPEEAAAIFLQIAAEHDFTLFEHYLADEAGHARDWEGAEEILAIFDQFARAVVSLRPAGLEVLICSDHGNVEDLTSRAHTLNRVAVMHFGERQVEAPSKDVSDVGRVVLRLLDVPA